MLECVNKNCGDNEKGICKSNFYDDISACKDRIKPNYEEENKILLSLNTTQSQSIKDMQKDIDFLISAKNSLTIKLDAAKRDCKLKEERIEELTSQQSIYEKIEQESNELKKKNRELEGKLEATEFNNSDLRKNLKHKDRDYTASINAYNCEIERLKEENKQFKSSIKTNEFNIKSLSIDYEGKENLIIKLRKEIEGLQKVNKEINDIREFVNKQAAGEINILTNNLETEREENKKLKDRINNYQDDILKKQDKIEELVNLKELNNQGYMEAMDTNIKEKDKQIERLGASTKEYYYNWLEAQKEIGKEKDLNRILKDKVEALKESVINLTELV